MGYWLVQMILIAAVMVEIWRLSSAKRHFVLRDELIYAVLLYLSSCILIINGEINQTVAYFWFAALAIGGVVLYMGTKSPGSRYYYKDYPLKKEQKMQELKKWMREELKKTGFPDALVFDGKVLIFYHISDQTKKEILYRCNEWINKNQCFDFMRWRKTMLLALVCFIGLLLAQILHFFIYSS